MADNNKIVYTINLETQDITTGLVKINKEIVDLTKSQKDLKKKNMETSTQFVEQKEKLKKLKTEYSGQSKILANVNKQRSTEAGYLEKLKTKLSLVTTQINKLSKEELKNEKVGGKLIKKQKALSDALKDTEQQGGNFHRSVGDYKTGLEGLEGVLGNVSNSFGKFGPIIAGAGQQFISFKEKVRAQVDQSPSVVKANNKIGVSFKSLWAVIKANPLMFIITLFTTLITSIKAYADAALVAAKNTTKIAMAFGITRESAKELRIEIEVLSKVWEVDLNEMIKSSSVFMQEFGISGAEALDLINKGFETGANSNNQFLELLKEYPTQLKNVGLSASETIALISQTENMGIFSDKGIDAIKESGLRLKEMNKSTKDALTGLGISYKKVQKDLESGNKGIFDIIKDVSDKMDELPPNSAKVGKAVADIFGGAGEDAGLRFLTTLKDIDLELGNLDSKMSESEEATHRLTGAWTDLTQSMLDSESLLSQFWTNLKGGLADYLELINDAEVSTTEFWTAWFTGQTHALIEARKEQKEIEAKATLDATKELHEIKKASKSLNLYKKHLLEEDLKYRKAFNIKDEKEWKKWLSSQLDDYKKFQKEKEYARKAADDKKIADAKVAEEKVAKARTTAQTRADEFEAQRRSKTSKNIETIYENEKAMISKHYEGLLTLQQIYETEMNILSSESNRNISTSGILKNDEDKINDRIYLERTLTDKLLFIQMNKISATIENENKGQQKVDELIKKHNDKITAENIDFNKKSNLLFSKYKEGELKLDEEFQKEKSKLWDTKLELLNLAKTQEDKEVIIADYNVGLTKLQEKLNDEKSLLLKDFDTKERVDILKSNKAKLQIAADHNLQMMNLTIKDADELKKAKWEFTELINNMTLTAVEDEKTLITEYNNIKIRDLKALLDIEQTIHSEGQLARFNDLEQKNNEFFQKAIDSENAQFDLKKKIWDLQILQETFLHNEKDVKYEKMEAEHNERLNSLEKRNIANNKKIRLKEIQDEINDKQGQLALLQAEQENHWDNLIVENRKFMDKFQISSDEVWNDIYDNLKESKKKEEKLLKLEYQKGVMDYDTYTAEMLTIQKQYNDDNLGLDQMMGDEKKQIQADTFSGLQSANQAFLDLNNAQYELELTQIDNKYNKQVTNAENDLKLKKANLEAQKEAGLLSQAEYDEQILIMQESTASHSAKIELARQKEIQKVAKETFDKNKKFQIAGAIMDGAAAIMGTWAGYAKLGPVGTTAAGLQTALIAAATGLQVATISKQEYSAAGGGEIDGPLHTQGGVQVTPNLEAEGGEFIVNRASTKKYKPLINSINNAGNKNGDSSSVKDIIDYNKLAKVLNDKKVYVVSKEISGQQKTDVVSKKMHSF